MTTKLESVNEHVMYIRNDGELRALLRGDVASLVAAIDAGHLEALRHYAQHGTLPVEQPVWPGLEVEPLGDDCWVVYSPNRTRVAGIEPFARGARGYIADVLDGTGGLLRWHGNTPQESVDAAREGLRKHWGLST